MSDPGIEHTFPNLESEGYRLTSPETTRYNCIAWSAEDDQRWWWPDSMNQFFWPSDIPRENNLENFILLYEKFGYEVCNDSNSEDGFQKIAVYVDRDGFPTHAARQLASGKWTSKLGRNKDIEHNTLEALFGNAYGTIGVVMKKIV